MKPNELRIGNLFIEEKSKKIIEVIGLEKNRIIFSGMFLEKWQAEPIILTHEWLIKFGFIHDNNWHYYLGENPITRDYLLSICWIDGDQFPFYRNGFFKIKYVHELQNLYLALTKEELVLQLVIKNS